MQILNFMSWVNSKAPVQRRVFGACVGEKHPLVAMYLDKVFAPQVVSFVVRDLASLFLPSCLLGRAGSLLLFLSWNSCFEMASLLRVRSSPLTPYLRWTWPFSGLCLATGPPAASFTVR